RVRVLLCRRRVDHREERADTTQRATVLKDCTSVMRDQLASLVMLVDDEAVVVAEAREVGTPEDRRRVTTPVVDRLADMPPRFEGHRVDLVERGVVLGPDLPCEPVERAVEEPLAPRLRVPVELSDVIRREIEVIRRLRMNERMVTV